MENLIIKPRNLAISRKVIGGMWIVFGIILLFLDKDLLGKLDWGRSVAYFIIGIIFFTPLVGSNKAQIEILEESLKIIWITWYRKVTVTDSEIESITLATQGILIKRKDKRPLRINLYLIDKEQKNKVYRFFTEYAKQKKFVLNR